MTIYPDASFLVSWLYKPDPLNAKARAWFAKHQVDDFLVSDWARFETINTLRDLCLRPQPPKVELSEALRRYISHLLQVGPFEFAAVDWDEVLKDAPQITAGFAARLKARSADVLHVAILEQVNPDLFVSGDKQRQFMKDQTDSWSVLQPGYEEAVADAPEQPSHKHGVRMANATTVIVMGNVQTLVQAVFDAAKTRPVKLQPFLGVELVGLGTGEEANVFLLAALGLAQ